MTKEYYEEDSKFFKQFKKDKIIFHRPNHPLFNKNYYMNLSYSYDLYNTGVFLQPSYENFDLVKGMESMIL